ncbi:LADA_0C03774g1_1 [Lachancea dasiensis]|uniref:LADA_0C03774g1_1 n=1 Tax=Lachancea dasiensis TaxID=1072105 RepID=A0A1G4IYJ2_9SACH|nr:LADA_0C03774g1_1 [Lachancea dasiensis]
MEYDDPIINHFRGQDPISKETLEELIKEQKNKDSSSKRGTGKLQLVRSNEQNCIQCEKALALFTDLLKLQYLIQKSWDLQALCKSVLVRFDIQTTGLSGQEPKLDHAETFYRDLALKTLTRCGKLSEAVEKLSLDSQELRDYLEVQSSDDPRTCLSDSACLLLEMWFLCGKTMRSLKRNVAALFIKAKLLLIDCELELMKAITKEDGSATWGETITSYRSFIKLLLQQIQDADTDNDQSSFEECLQVFLDVEAMFNAMNINYILYETQHNDLDQESSSNAKSSIVQEASEIRDINDLVESSFKNDASNDENEFEHLTTGNFESSNERRLSETSALSVSLMMEKTSLKRELPSLLQAFNNAKRLEQELEIARGAKGSTPEGSLTNSSLSSSLLSPSSSMFLSSASRFGSELGGAMYSSKASTHSDEETNRAEELPAKGNNPTSSLIPSSFTNPITTKNDNLSRVSSLQKVPPAFRATQNIQGFGSDVLNNLYGLGKKQ